MIPEPQTIAIVRAEGCDCDFIVMLGGHLALGVHVDAQDGYYDPCPHGSVVRELTAEDIPADLAAKVVEQIADKHQSAADEYPVSLRRFDDLDKMRLLRKAARLVREAEAAREAQDQGQGPA